MKKVGIITFHNAMSYGAVLQATALQKKLIELGVEVEIIDYMCESIKNTYVRLFPKTKNLKFNIKMSLLCRKKFLWRKYLREYRNRQLILSEEVKKSNLHEFGKKYDIIISGSDQVFNDVCTNMDYSYFLDFVPNEKKYTYAASFGFDTLSEDRVSVYYELLKGFQKLSIREESGCEIVNKLLARECNCNIDPTFLLSRKQWDLIEKHESRKPYIFVFSVLKPVKMLEYAKKIGNDMDCDVIYLDPYAIPSIQGIKYIDPVSPAEFIGYIKNAEVVITNSFHGMAFSIIYHKLFWVELNARDSRNIRCENLLRKLGISGNEIIDGEAESNRPLYDWEKVESIIELERAKAENYLLEICK